MRELRLANPTKVDNAVPYSARIGLGLQRPRIALFDVLLILRYLLRQLVSVPKPEVNGVRLNTVNCMKLISAILLVRWQPRLRQAKLPLHKLPKDGKARQEHALVR